MKKGEESYRERNKLLFGIIIGALAAIVIGWLVYILIYNNTNADDSRINIRGEEIFFNNSEVHQNVGNDFPVTVVPVYDSVYCEAKFNEKYGRTADECFIKTIRTFSRLNPLVTEVECACRS